MRAVGGEAELRRDRAGGGAVTRCDVSEWCGMPANRLVWSETGWLRPDAIHAPRSNVWASSEV